MSTAIALKPQTGIDANALQQLILGGDLAQLTPVQKVQYYNRVCELIGLNPLTKPFDYIRLNGKEVLYANKGCAEQLRMIHKISIKITSRETIEGVYVVTVEAAGADGRVDSSTGAVPILGVKGEALANAFLKCETKAKRRVTLSICGLNMLDETEVESIQNAAPTGVRPEQPMEGDGFPQNDGVYRIDFGKYNRKSLSEIYFDPKLGPKALMGYIQYLEDAAKKVGKPLGEQPLRFISEADKFLGEQEKGPREPGSDDN